MTFDLTRCVVDDREMTQFANDFYGRLFKVRYISLFEGIDFASRTEPVASKHDLYNLDMQLVRKGFTASNDEQVGEIFETLNCKNPRVFGVYMNPSETGDAIDLIVKRPDPRISLAQRISQFVGIDFTRADGVTKLREACAIDNLCVMQNLVTALEHYRMARNEITINEEQEWQAFSRVCHVFVERGGDIGTVRHLRDALLLSSIRYDVQDNNVTGFLDYRAQQEAIAEIREVTLMCAQRDTGTSRLTWDNMNGFEYLAGLNGAVEFFGSLPFCENDQLRTGLYMNMQGEIYETAAPAKECNDLTGDVWTQTLLHITTEAARAAERLMPATTHLVSKVRPLTSRLLPDPRLGLN